MAAETDAEYADHVRYIFANADFSGAAKRYQNPLENWARFDTLLGEIDRPLAKLKVVHIAGTNGKGTTSALCDAMLRSTGVRVGLFTSPHLHSWRERIRVDGALVSKEAVVEAMRLVRPAVEAIGYASPFEKLSALAFVAFARAGVEWAVLETGLGGRWDCTNHSAPAVCGITRIGLDHMNVLGGTVALIANEKAGIIKAGVPAFAVPQEDEALPVLHAAAGKVGVELEVVGSAEGLEVPFWLSPAHQRLNAALATAMLGSLRDRGLLPPAAGAACSAGAFGDTAWAAARGALSWPCRFEVLRPRRLGGAGGSTARLLLDVAHNEPAFEALLRSVAAGWADSPLVVVFGANSDKDVGKILSLLHGQPRMLVGLAVQSSHPKALSAEAVVDAAAGVGAASQPAWRAVPSMLEALSCADEALRAYTQHGAAAHGAGEPLVLCCGSVFVAADMRQALAAEEPALFADNDWVFEAHNEPALLM